MDEPGAVRTDPAPVGAPGVSSPARVSDGLTVWLTGLPSAGKTTLANALASRLREGGYPVEVLDGDDIRTNLTPDLGYSRTDRDQNVRRVGWVAHLLSRNRVVAICALVSPYRATRDEVRAAHGGRFFEVFVATPIDVCAMRDVKGLYARQSTGSMQGLTGVDDDYEPPLSPDAVVHTQNQTVAESVEELWAALPW